MDRRLLGLLGMLGLAGSLSTARATEKELLSLGAEVEVSNQPNPIWSKEKLVDGKDSPTSGWLCNKAVACWAELKLPADSLVDEIWVRQAAFPQTGQHRYARPKRLNLLFDGKNGAKFELEDKEETFQKLTFPPRKGSTLRIEVESYYDEASVPEMSGFQEIKVFKSLETVAAPNIPSSGGGGEDGQIDEKEKKILNLLNQLMVELEDYFMTN